MKLKIHATHSQLAISLSALITCAPALADNNDVEEVVIIGKQSPYFEKSRSTALKFDAEDLDTPFSTSVINSTILEDLKANTLEDAYTYISGFSRSGSSANSFTIRGHSADLQNIQVDGLPGLASRFGSPVTANIERVEVLKGPASVLYGWMDPGGMVNIITKKPQAEQHTSIDVTAQHYTDQGKSGFESSIDTGGALNTDGSISYRLIAGGEHADSFRDHVESESLYLFPSIAWQLDEDSRLDLQFEYTKQDRSADNGLFVLDKNINTVADIETYYQEPGDFDNDEGYGLALAYSTAINDQLSANVKLRSIWHEDERDLYENNKVEENDQQITRRNRHQYNEREYHFIDANLNYQFGETIKHSVLLGINGGYEYRQYDRLAFDKRGAKLDIYNPVYTGDILANDPGSFRNWDLYSGGIYAMDRIQLNDSWIVLAGLRFDTQKGDYHERYLDKDTVKTAKESVSDTTFNTGLVYKLNEQVSLYGSYAESFNPQAIPKLDARGEQLDPESGEQAELGVKYESSDGRLNLNLAYFDTVKSNISEENANGQEELIGEISSQGLELNLQAQPTDNLQLQLGYSYTDAEVSGGGAGDKIEDRLGNPPAAAPKNSAFILSRYNHPKMVWGGLVGASLGIKYEDERYTDANSKRRVLLPSYQVVDLGLYYELENIKYALNIANLSNEEYFTGGSRNTRIYAGEPTKVSLSMRFNF